MNGAVEREIIGVVLAAGKGTRMRSNLPKVLHEVAGRPMLHWVLDALEQAGCAKTLVVIGHEGELVRQACADREVGWVEQRQQLGTGHALAQVESQLTAAALLLVVSGDVPLVSPATLSGLVTAAEGSWGALAVAEVESPRSLGRVLTRDEGSLARIVEAADASEEELAVKRVNAGLYALPAPDVFRRLATVGTDNAKGEIYLTDALGRAVEADEPVALFELDDPAEAWGINDRSELARTSRLMVERHLAALARSGVTILDPRRTVIEPMVQVGPDTVVHPGVSVTGTSVIGSACTLQQGVWIRNGHLGDGVVVAPYSVIDEARIEAGAAVGPFARLRPGSRVGPAAKVGNFVEMKNASLGAGSKASHLSYLGDATIGEGANIGAGTITCNYDGESKHSTEIGDGAFIGSDTMLVAPLSVGEGATTGAGSVISRDVPAGALAVERSPQRIIRRWKNRRRSEDE